MSRSDDAWIADALIEWHGHKGRHELPWQQERTPYRVWVSEIMLQQTQVMTVIAYYQRFMARFPDVQALAAAPLDEVLHLWSGLGYYARARNLHRAAQRICQEFAGEFPQQFAQVASLPGIGRSSAGAILALSGGQRFAILDGNVKRVLSRFFGVQGDLTERANSERLWELAERCTPSRGVHTYTQAIMDLGATLCVRRKPLCESCPLAQRCYARYTGRQHDIPAPRRARARATRHAVMLIAQRADGCVLLERRAPSGIWGALWCLPQFDSPQAARHYALHELRDAQLEPQPLAPLQHAFTHFDLVIAPLLASCAGSAGGIDEREHLWYHPGNPPAVGLPAPIKALLERIASPTMFDLQQGS